MRLDGTEEVEGSGKATVTPSLLRELSSVSEMEREIAGRGGASWPEMDRWIETEIFKTVPFPSSMV